MRYVLRMRLANDHTGSVIELMTFDGVQLRMRRFLLWSTSGRLNDKRLFV